MIWIESSKEQHLFETETFYNFRNVFTVTFDQFHSFLPNKNIFCFKNKNEWNVTDSRVLNGSVLPYMFY